jgi:hypothetical protein
VQRTPFRIEQNPNASQSKITAQELQWNNGPAARKQASEPKKKDLASSDCCKRCSQKRFTSSDSILAAKSCTMLVLPGMSFCRRPRRSWSNKLRRLLSPYETVDPWCKLQELVYYALHLLNVMCGCLDVCTCLLCNMRSFVGSSVWLVRIVGYYELNLA